MASAGTTPFYRREYELQGLQELAGPQTKRPTAAVPRVDAQDAG
jgi:hypothetical protein